MRLIRIAVQRLPNRPFQVRCSYAVDKTICTKPYEIVQRFESPILGRCQPQDNTKFFNSPLSMLR